LNRRNSSEDYAVNARRTPYLPALSSGTAASIATAAVLALLARAEGKAAVQPINATSHWLHGERAGAVRQADAAHTLLGYLTHHASAIFWGLILAVWHAYRPPAGALQVLRDASAVSAVAAAVDYGMAPKRLTPGWEAVLSRRSIAIVFAAMAVGLAAGALLAREPESRR
jgi:hypothetical protein